MGAGLRLIAFYHCWLGGQWFEPCAEFREALGDGVPLRLCPTYASSEAPTINALRDYALEHDGAVLYAHTKGAATVEPFRDRWRRSMTARVVANWRENLARLEQSCGCDRGMVFGCCGRMVGLGDCCCAPEAVTCPECRGTGHAVDAVGCHWLTEGQFPGIFGPMTIPAEGSGFFGGNFWMARCDYLRTLPPCESEPRWKAESWIGLGKPRVVDLLPGWPHDNRWPEFCT